MRVRIHTKSVELTAEMLDGEAADDLSRRLPVEARANRWGEEVYFDCPLAAHGNAMKQTMDVGDIGYWVEGGALALFFGPTPASTDDRPRAAVPVALVGRITGDAVLLTGVADGDIIRLEAL